MRSANGGLRDDLTNALAGVCVVEIGDRIAVGACGGLLAQLGADVVVLEPRNAKLQDKWRNPAAALSGKRAISVGMRQPENEHHVIGLVAAADVVLLSSDRSAWSATTWDSARPEQQVVCDITAFGHDGPLAGRPASDALVQAWSGAAETTGPRDGPPTVVGAPVLEMESAVYAASAIVAALIERLDSGRGQRVDVALFDVGVNALLAFLALPFTGRLATRDGNRHLALAPWNAYQASDGWVQICSPTNDMWVRLCKLMGRAELVIDSRFQTPSQRLEHVDLVDEVVAAWVSRRTVDECVELLTKHVIPVSGILAREAIAAEPNLLHRGMIHEYRHPVSKDRVLLPGSPLTSAFRPAIAASMPEAPNWGSARNLAAANLTTRDHIRPGRPLDGIRVVEIGMNTVAPLAGRQLAALGADVIKVEPPTGDSNRVNGPLRGDGESYVFALSNTDKRGLTLDLKVTEDRDKLWALLSTADVLIENLKPGSLTRLGFGSQKVRQRHPELVYCSINGFGHDSVYPNRPALDTVIQAMSGLVGTTLLDGIPYKAGISVSDQIGGQFGLLGVTAALFQRRQTGKGATLDLAMQDGTAWVTHPVWNQPGSPVEVFRDQNRWHVGDHSGIAAVLSVQEVLEHPHTQTRRLLVEVSTPDGDAWTVLQTPFRLRDTPARVRSAMPRLGFVDPVLVHEIEEAQALSADKEEQHA